MVLWQWYCHGHDPYCRDVTFHFRKASTRCTSSQGGDSRCFRQMPYHEVYKTRAKTDTMTNRVHSRDDGDAADMENSMPNRDSPILHTNTDHNPRSKMSPNTKGQRSISSYTTDYSMNNTDDSRSSHNTDICPNPNTGLHLRIY